MRSRPVDVTRFAPPADVFALLDELFGPGRYDTRVAVDGDDVLLSVSMDGQRREVAAVTSLYADPCAIAHSWRFMMQGVRAEAAARRKGVV